jgi:serine protease Do
MRKHILATIAVLPMLFNVSQAEQRWTTESGQPFGFSSEEPGKSSYLGVDIADISSDRLGALKLKEEQGVEVTMVDQDAPAGKAGIKEHDVILTMNGTAIESKTQLQRMIHEMPAGRLISLGLSRDGQPMTIKVQLADRRNEFSHMKIMKDGDWEKGFNVEIPPIPNMPDFDVPNIGVVVVHSSMRSGLMVENITPQLGEFFGVKNGNGVLVRSVEKGSRADKAGLRAGDVITRVGDQPVHDTSDFTHALHSHTTGSINVSVMRDKKEQTLTITLPERKESGGMIEESLEAPELDEETRIELSKVQDEVARLQPQMELATMEMRKALCAQTKQTKEQAEKLSQELAGKVQEDFQQGNEKLQEELEELEQETPAESFDI